jgi:Fe2+ or Zn2+ uptake regulation protein
VKSVEELTTLFRQSGRKVTPQRQAIFRVLQDTDEHPTAEAVYAEVSAEMPTISLRTVYQVLNDLASMGELHQLHLGTGSSRFDPNLGPHHHLVCESCGGVRDLQADFPDVRVPTAAGGGFQVSVTEIVFRGVCAECAAAASSAAPAS